MRPARVAGAKATDKTWLRPSTDKAPKLQLQPTPFGFRYAAIRRPIFNAATHQYVRTTLFVAPITVLIPPNDVYNVANVNVPIDDTRTMFHFIAWSELAIVEFRRIMVDAVRRFVADGTAIGAEVHAADAALCAFEGVIPKTDDWRTLGRVAGTKAG